MRARSRTVASSHRIVNPITFTAICNIQPEPKEVKISRAYRSITVPAEKTSSEWRPKSAITRPIRPSAAPRTPCED
jgi:hypothetical protein